MLKAKDVQTTNIESYTMNPHVINNLDFAKKNLSLTGKLTEVECSRLAALLNSANQQSLLIQYTLIGHAEHMSHPTLELSIEVDMPVICQRCLMSMQYPLALHFIYAISDDAEAQDASADDVDFIEPDRAMNLVDLIEDEVIAALPIAPKHETECGDSKMHSVQKESPFAVLKGLKRN